MPVREFVAVQEGETSAQAWRERLAQLGLAEHVVGFRELVVPPPSIRG